MAEEEEKVPDNNPPLDSSVKQGDNVAQPLADSSQINGDHPQNQINTHSDNAEDDSESIAQNQQPVISE